MIIIILLLKGGGKSLTYQLPGMCSIGLSIVISPLISLIMDQIHQLKNYDIPSLYLSSTLTDAERRSVFDDLFGVSNDNNPTTMKFLYVTPEMVSINFSF